MERATQGVYRGARRAQDAVIAVFASTQEGTMFARSPHRCLLVGLLVAATALGGCAGGKATAGPSCDRPDGAFDEAATRLEFRMQAADRVQVDEARRILCERLGAIGIDHRVRATGDGLTVEVPRESAQGDPDGHSLVFGVGELAFYDWEPNVIGPRGTPAPRDAAVTGGVAAGDSDSGGISLYAAVQRASKRPAAKEADNARAASRFYAVDAKARRVFAGRTATSPQLGSPTRAAALALVPARLRDAAKVYEVKPDTVIVRTSTQPAGSSTRPASGSCCATTSPCAGRTSSTRHSASPRARAGRASPS